MTKDKIYNITPAQISEIGLSLRKEDPDYIWGTNEYRNAIFEVLMIVNNLPWNSDLGIPDWGSQQVKDLHRELSEFFEREDEDRIIGGVEARCNANQCNWKAEGQIIFDQIDRVLCECDITEKCRNHHLGVGKHIDHNRFGLYLKNKKVGQASVSSQACTGYIDEMEEDLNK